MYIHACIHSCTCSCAYAYPNSPSHVSLSPSLHSLLRSRRGCYLKTNETCGDCLQLFTVLWTSCGATSSRSTLAGSSSGLEWPSTTPLHSPQVSYPHSPTPQSTGLIPSFPHSTVHRSHTLIPPLHSPQVSYPHSPTPQSTGLIPSFPQIHSPQVSCPHSPTPQSTGLIPSFPHSTVHRSHTLIPPLHSPQVSCPHSPNPQSTGLIPSFPHSTVHRSHTLIPPLHSPQVSYPHSQAYVLIPKLFPLTHNVHVQ